MQGSLDAPPIVIRQKRRWILAAIPLVLFLQGVRAYISGDKSTGLIFVVLALITFGFVTLQLFIPTRLEIGPQGVRVVAALRTWRRDWIQICGFRRIRWGYRDCIGFDYAAGAGSRPARSGGLSRITGADGLMAAGMEIDAEELATILNQARERWVGAEAAASVSPASLSPASTFWWVFMALTIGRVSRRFYWISLGVTACVSALVGLLPNQLWLGLMLLFLGTTFVSRGRLRDLGRSPAWQILVVPAVFVLEIPAALLGGVVGMVVVSCVAIGGGVLALGLAPGNPGANRFGAPPVSPAQAVGEVFS
jgi:uncharacterized membrane protein YhaH (DUF805 family)